MYNRYRSMSVMMTWAARPSRLHSHHTHGARPENSHCFAALHIDPVDSRVARREDIGQEQGLVVDEQIGNNAGPKVDVGHVLGLAAVKVDMAK